MKVKYLIIGAGISGLTFANYVDDYLIVEKENEVGGYCRTIKKKDYVWDYAGHFFHFKTEEFKNKFLLFHNVVFSFTKLFENIKVFPIWK